MKSKSGLLQALRKFTKGIWYPEAIICDIFGEQTPNTLHKFFSEIGTTLRFLEEGTLWENKDKLYVGLIKEAVWKDMNYPNCNLAS